MNKPRTLKPEKLVRREGFWESRSEPFLPMPIASHYPWKGLQNFVNALRELEADLQANHQDQINAYRGWSNCRCCNRHNGSEEYEHKGWRWPEGFMHYVVDHNVRPSLAFEEFVLGRHLRSKTGEEMVDEKVDEAAKELMAETDALWTVEAKKVLK